MTSTYEDLLLEIKRDFIIVGLTGYTGSGCTTAAGLLVGSEKLSLPSCFAASFYQEADNLEGRRYNKLKTVWGGINWEPFVSIEVAGIILALVIDQMLLLESQPEKFSRLYHLSDSKRKDLQYLRQLRASEPFSPSSAEKVINAYSVAKSLFFQFKEGYAIELFTKIMQDFGDQLRRFGVVQLYEAAQGAVLPDHMLVIPTAISRLIDAYRVSRRSRFFVIDSFRNPFEVEFFKRKHSEFFLIGIIRSAIHRRAELIRKSNDSFVDGLEEREKGRLYDRIKDNIHEWVTSQNLDECMQKADMIVYNREDDSKTFSHLKYYLVKLLSLAQKPGCVPPTDDERSMQIALTARQMSGCLSRQVGAVIVGATGYVLGVGWNDPPEGQVPCALRSSSELIETQEPDPKVFSEYERSNVFVASVSDDKCGSNPFCAKDHIARILRKGKVAEFTRALHAEENAFLQIAKVGGVSVVGSTLFTTSSTCTLCAKKAYHLGIRRIVYIEEYPGPAIAQTIRAGDRPIELHQFEGIMGAAYFKLYSSILPEKDLIELYRRS